VSFDTTSCYRLTNGFLGEGQSLDLYPEVEGELQMSDTEDSRGQYWKLVPAEDRKYEIRNVHQGDGFSLDVWHDGNHANDSLCLAAIADVTGQAWTLTPWGDGTYRLTNDFTGPERFLDLRSDNHDPCFATGNNPGMHWTLSPVEETPDVVGETETDLETRPVSRRAGKIANGFFIVGGIFCSAALLGGAWMLISGLHYRENHREAQATVVIENTGNPRAGKKTKPVAHLQFEVEGKRYDILAPAEESAKDRNKYREKYRDGNRIAVWYPSDNPQAADVEGDRGVLLGGVAFTGVGVLFSFFWVLAAIAEFFPNRFLRAA
jgi:hypothetical protein